MKYFNHITSLMMLVALSTTAIAQTTTKDYSVKMTSGKIILENIDELEIQGYNGTEVIFSTDVQDEDHSDRKQGLRILNTAGLNDNTGLGISVEKSGNELYASQISSDCSCNKISVKIPKNLSLSIVHGSHEADKILVEDFESELEISTNNHDIELINVTGPMAVKTLYGSIDAKFKRLSQTGSVSIYSVYDLVDITLPKNAKANVSLTTPYGDVYTNAVIQIANANPIKEDKSTKSCNSGYTNNKIISGTINGGGVELLIKSSYEDIYLRQM